MRASAACFSCSSSRAISSSSLRMSSCSCHSSSATFCLYLAYSFASASGSLWTCWRASTRVVTWGAGPERFRFLLFGDRDPSAGTASPWAAPSASSSCSRCRKSSWSDSAVKRDASYEGSCLMVSLLMRSWETRGNAAASKASGPWLRIQVNNNSDSRGV